VTVQHIVRRSAASTAAVNVAVAIDLPIDSTAATPITSPGGAITEIAVSVGFAGAEAASTGTVLAVRLSGAAVIDGPQDIDAGQAMIGATSTAFQVLSGGLNRIKLDPPIQLKVNLPLVVQGFQNGVDTGTQMYQVELVIVS
jgi:hypothetical protein